MMLEMISIDYYLECIDELVDAVNVFVQADGFTMTR